MTKKYNRCCICDKDLDGTEYWWDKDSGINEIKYPIHHKCALKDERLSKILTNKDVKFNCFECVNCKRIVYVPCSLKKIDNIIEL